MAARARLPVQVFAEVPAFAGVTAFFALLQVFGLWSGAAGLAYRGIFAVAMTVLAAGLAVLFSRQFNTAPDTAPKTAPDPAPVAAGWILWPVRVVAAVALAWLALVWARLWLLAWRRPPFDWDGLYYHIPAIHEWVLAGRVCWLETPPDIPFVNYPMGVEATTFFLHALHGSSALLNACNLWYWPLAFLALVVLARRLGARDGWAWLAGALLAASPVVVSQSVTSYTDVAAAATMLGALAASLLLVFPLGGRRLWRALLWGASVGLMAGAKGSGLPAAVILVVGTCAAGLILQRGQWRTWWSPLVAGAGVAVAVGGYWYLRSLLQAGNPVYPIQVAIGYKVIFPGYDHVAFSAANLPQWLAAYPAWLRLPVAWLQFDAPIRGAAPVGGLGYLWLAGGVPAILVLGLLLFRRRTGDAAFGPFFCLAGLALVLLGTQTASWWSRFTVWLIGLGLPSLVVTLQRAQAAGRSLAVRLLPVIVAAAAVGVGIWESGRTLWLEEQDGRSVDANSQIVYPTSMQRIVVGLDELPGLDRFLAEPVVGRTPWGRVGTLLGGVLAQPLGAREIVVVPLSPTADDLVSLQAAGATWLLWDLEAAGELPAELREMVADELVFRPSSAGGYLFLRLRERALPAPRE